MSDDQFIDANKIGSGGFGTVYKCKDSEGDNIAQKVLRVDADDESKKQFAREVQLLSGLDHPNVIKIIDMKLDDYPLYFSMPLYKCSLRAEFPALLQILGLKLRQVIRCVSPSGFPIMQPQIHP